MKTSFGIILYGATSKCQEFAQKTNDKSCAIISKNNGQYLNEMRKTKDFSLALIPVNYNDIFGDFKGSFGAFVQFISQDDYKNVYEYIIARVQAILQQPEYTYVLEHTRAILCSKGIKKMDIETAFTLTGMFSTRNNDDSVPDFGYLPCIFSMLKRNPTKSILLSATLPTSSGQFSKWNNILINITSCGKSENDEFWDCALRELHEETGFYLNKYIVQNAGRYFPFSPRYQYKYIDLVDDIWLKWGNLYLIFLPICDKAKNNTYIECTAKCCPSI